MQKDFHYNMTLALAINAGIDLDAATEIAWSNQFTDECKDFEKYGIRTMVDITWKASDCFIPEVQRSVFVPFHFLPGSKESLVVSAGSELARILVDRAIGTKDTIALGIALHSFQDTYSHHDFMGIQSDYNAKHRWDLTSMVAPRIGHAEFGHDPDIIGHEWTGFSRLIDNSKRFEAAALDTYRILNMFSGKNYCQGVIDSLTDFWKITDYDSRKTWLLNWADIPEIFTFKNIDAGIRNKNIDKFVAAAKKQQSIVTDYIK